MIATILFYELIQKILKYIFDKFEIRNMWFIDVNK